MKAAIKSELIYWNSTFPLDRIYRKRNGILFDSIEHRKICQINLYLEWCEDQLFKEHEENFAELQKKADKYKNGTWIEKIETEMSDEEFDQIEI